MVKNNKKSVWIAIIALLLIVGSSTAGYFIYQNTTLRSPELKYDSEFVDISEVKESKFISIDILSETLFDDKTEMNISIVGVLESCEAVSNDSDTDYDPNYPRYYSDIELKTHETGIHLEYEKSINQFGLISVDNVLYKSHYFDVGLSNGTLIDISIKTYSIEFEEVDEQWIFSTSVILDLTYLIVISGMSEPEIIGMDENGIVYSKREFISIDILSETLYNDKIKTNLLIVGELGTCEAVPHDFPVIEGDPWCYSDMEFKAHATGLYLLYYGVTDQFSVGLSGCYSIYEYYFDISLSNGITIDFSIQSCSFEYEEIDGSWIFSASVVLDLIYCS